LTKVERGALLTLARQATGGPSPVRQAPGPDRDDDPQSAGSDQETQ
jgi:hypothetical protein